MSTGNDVRAASSKFYSALNSMANGDAAPMAEVWVTSPQATAQHPVGGRDRTYETVVASFAKVAEIARGGEIRIIDQEIDVGGDMAVETGVETGSVDIAGHSASIEHRVTNVYRREEDGWKLQHHHTDLSPAMLEVLAKLKATT